MEFLYPVNYGTLEWLEITEANWNRQRAEEIVILCYLFFWGVIAGRLSSSPGSEVAGENGDRLTWNSPHSADCTQWVFIRHRVCARCLQCNIWLLGPYGILRRWTQKWWQPSQSCLNSHACYWKRLSIHICWVKNNKCCRLVFVPVFTDNKTEFQGILSYLLIIAC